MLDPVLPLEKSFGFGKRKQVQAKRGGRNRTKGAWKGEEVLRRMEEGDRAEAQFWLSVRDIGADMLQTRGNKAKKRRSTDVDEVTDDMSEPDFVLDQAEATAGDRGGHVVDRPRKKAKRATVLDALYDTAVSQLAGNDFRAL